MYQRLNANDRRFRNGLLPTVRFSENVSSNLIEFYLVYNGFCLKSLLEIFLCEIIRKITFVWNPDDLYYKSKWVLPQLDRNLRIFSSPLETFDFWVRFKSQRHNRHFQFPTVVLKLKFEENLSSHKILLFHSIFRYSGKKFKKGLIDEITEKAYF